MDSGAEYYKRFLDGDENAIVDIIREYNDGLIMYLNGVMNDLNAAEDSAEDTFFKLLTRKPSFSGKSSNTSQAKVTTSTSQCEKPEASCACQYPNKQ